MDSTLTVGESLSLPVEEARHISKVLRGRSGDAFEVVDGERRLFVAELREGREAVVVESLDDRPSWSSEVVLYQAVPKGRHMDLVVEKATELGVASIVPLVTDHGVVRLDDGAAKLQRWHRIAEAAARQSLQRRIPEVSEPVKFAEAVARAGEKGLLLHNTLDLPALEECARADEVNLFVGPEGGWSAGELRSASEAGMKLAQLGPYRLRSETAGIVAVARARAVLDAAGWRRKV